MSETSIPKSTNYDEKQTVIYTTKQHIRQKDMWLGSKAICDADIFVRNKDLNRFTQQNIKLSDTAYTIIDEVLVNACDHKINYPKEVSKIAVKFDTATGILSVENDGRGIPVYALWFKENDFGVDTKKFDELTEAVAYAKLNGGQAKWNPEIITSCPLTGTNLEDRPIRITGGVNGVGLKGTNLNSKWFKIETVDTNRKKLYQQKFKMENEKLVIGTPKLTPFNDATFTRITILPDYKHLGYASELPTDIEVENLAKFIETRCYQIAVYAKLKVEFNGTQIEFDKFSNFTKLFVDECTINEKKIFPVYNCTIKHEKFPWNIAVAPSSEGRAYEHMSIVNGIYVRNGGTHMDYLLEQIVEFIKPKISEYYEGKKFYKTYVSNHILLFMCGAINKPGFDAQKKNTLKMQISDLTEYKFTEKQLTNIWKLLEPFIISNILQSKQEKPKNKMTNASMKNIAMARDALNAGKKKTAQSCKLFIPEGESASKLIDGGLSARIPDFSYENYGYYNIRGVPINSRRAIKIVKDPRTNKDIIIRTNKLIENERINSLIKILGLDLARSPDGYNTNEELGLLRYGGVILAVDQDEDGKGNIASLLLDFFSVFFPNLLKRGYIQRLSTPIIRAMTKRGKIKDVYEFYSNAQFKEWKSGLNLSEIEFAKKYTLDYSKGQAHHSKEQYKIFFSDLQRHLLTYKFEDNPELYSTVNRELEKYGITSGISSTVIDYIDDNSLKYFKIYMGDNPELRKKELKTDVSGEYTKIYGELPCSTHFQVDAKSFQRYHISRSIPSLDGLTLARRKVLRAMKLPSFPKQNQKISNIVSFTQLNCAYHHGEKSLEETVKNMAQVFPGSNNIPLLLGFDNGFGTRKDGGASVAQSRYLFCKPNTEVINILFPPEDDDLLEYNYDDGKQIEPKYFVPIFPMLLAENYQTPSHGWMIQLWARDLLKVIKNIENKINGLPLIPMPIDTYNWHGTIAKWNGRTYSIGSYEIIDDTTLLINELPHGVFSMQYATGNAADREKKRKKYQKEVNLLKEQFDKAKSEGNEKFVKKYEAKHQFSLKNAGKQYNIKDAVFEPPEFHTNVLSDKEFVKDVYEDTNDDGVRIIVKMEPGAIQRLLEMPYDKTRPFDNIHEHLMLRKVITSNINCITTDGEIYEFDTYEQVFNTWFKVREKLYAKRTKRIITISNYQILLLEQIQRFSKIHKELGISGKSKIHGEEVLLANKFPMLDAEMIRNPGTVPTEEINIYENASFKYILDLKYSQLQEEAMHRRDEEIGKLKLLKTTYENSNNGKTIWLDELDKLKKIILEVRKNGWGYSEPKTVLKNPIS